MHISVLLPNKIEGNESCNLQTMYRIRHEKQHGDPHKDRASSTGWEPPPLHDNLVTVEMNRTIQSTSLVGQRTQRSVSYTDKIRLGRKSDRRVLRKILSHRPLNLLMGEISKADGKVLSFHPPHRLCVLKHVTL